ncbi:deoxynucleoside kinase, partial [Pseudomonas sp. MPR-R5A]
HASLDTLLTRIKKRGREIEKNISPLYLEQLAIDYDNKMKKFEEQNPNLPILRFNGDELDFVNNENDMKHIIQLLTDS